MGTHEDFVHLHLHTEYSLLDGANRIAELFTTAKAYGMSAIGLTDHGNMFGALEFYPQGRATGINPILGCELYVAPGSRYDRVPPRASVTHPTILPSSRKLSGVS